MEFKTGGVVIFQIANGQVQHENTDTGHTCLHIEVVISRPNDYNPSLTLSSPFVPVTLQRGDCSHRIKKGYRHLVNS
jgi:hypothetical protein